MKKVLHNLMAVVCAFLILTPFVSAQNFDNGEIGITLSSYGRLRVHSPSIDNNMQIDRLSPLAGGNLNQVFDYLNDADNVDSLRLVANPQVSDVELYMSVDNNYNDPAFPPDVEVKYNIYGWTSGGFVLAKFTFINRGAEALEIKPGFEMIPKIDGSYGFEKIEWKSSSKTLEVYRGIFSTRVGFKCFNEDLTGAPTIMWFDGYNASDTALYNWLHSTDFTGVFSSDDNGPVSFQSFASQMMQPNEERELYFGIAVGANAAELETNLAVAEIKYTEIVTSVRELGNTIPDDYSLAQNYPNPFNPSTKINFDLPNEGFVSLKVYNAVGEIVADLVSSNLGAGSYEYEFNAAGLSSGIYFYTLKTGSFAASRKMLLIK
jgi:hypothetical protein